MGDSAHATVPFYGQGMNAGFEDCTVMFELMEKHGDDWKSIFEEYNRERKPDGDALQDLSLGNYFEMRDFVADPMFLLRKKIEAKFSALYPDKWMPLYSQVTFSSIRYSVALKQGEVQKGIMDQIMEQSDIVENWDSPEVIDQILSLCV
jgi:kynurenine 3-monooxygenase